MIEINNEKIDYAVYGMKRSGHHAIINWISNHYNSFIHYNNCFIENNSIFVANKNEVTKNGDYPYELKILSFEDRPVFEESSFDNIKKLNLNCKNILILRDAYNNYASRFVRKISPVNKQWNKIWKNYDDVDIWINYANEFIGKTNYLNSIKINYNKWFSCENYRKELSNNFGNFTDRGLLDVLNFGGGSSFDNISFDKNAQKMNVLNRWKYFYFEKNYVEKILNNDEIKKLNYEIFNILMPKIY